MTEGITMASRHDLSLPNRMPGQSGTVEHPPTRIGRLVLLLVVCILLFWGGLGSWATLVPINSAVVAPGKFEVEGDLPSVQHLEGGLIREVHVREGDYVERGQVLVELADTVSAAQDQILLSQLVNALALDQRLGAELREDPEIEFSPELQKFIGQDAVFADLVSAQRDAFRSNNAMWAGQASILQDRVDELEDQYEALQVRNDTLQSRLALVQTELADLKGLYDKGLISRARYTSRQETEISLIGDMGASGNQMDALREQIAGTQERLLQLRRDRASGIGEQRQQVKERILDLRQRMLANRDVRERSLVRAPVSGQVMGLAYTAPGEVIQPAREIMKIVPDQVSYIISSQVRTEDVDQVSKGDFARVRLTAYNFRTTPPVEGEVVHVSADSFVDERTGMPYYRADIRIPEAALAAVPDVQIQPGMPAEVMIMTGEQTVTNYILGPVLAGLNAAFRESN